MPEVKYRTLAELEAGLDWIRQSPKHEGEVMLIARRPRDEMREVVLEATLDPLDGLVGDNWKVRGSGKTADGAANPEMQINIMNARVIGLIAPDKERWALAGDQLYVDLDLSEQNLPPGTRVAIGTAVIEVTPPPHLGCKKFNARFGADALKFVNSPVGKEMHLRGVNARIVQAGVVRVGDAARKL